jgi:hypothetical protein
VGRGLLERSRLRELAGRISAALSNGIHIEKRMGGISLPLEKTMLLVFSLMSPIFAL